MSVCVYIYIYICVCVCIYIYVCIYICMCIYMYVCVYICMYVYIYVYFFFHHKTCESTCDTLASSAANQGENSFGSLRRYCHFWRYRTAFATG